MKPFRTRQNKPQADYIVRVDVAAKRKMEGHARFLARVSVPAAQILRNAYISALKSLETNPQRCPLYIPNVDIEAELRYLLFTQRYRIVFEIVDTTVYVYDVQDVRQNEDKNLV